jgi:hypothetical protein
VEDKNIDFQEFKENDDELFEKEKDEQKIS